MALRSLPQLPDIYNGTCTRRLVDFDLRSGNILSNRGLAATCKIYLNCVINRFAYGIVSILR